MTNVPRVFEEPKDDYHTGLGESEENLRLMRLIGEQYLHTPFFGSREMTQCLIPQGHDVNRKRVHVDDIRATRDIAFVIIGGVVFKQP